MFAAMGVLETKLPCCAGLLPAVGIIFDIARKIEIAARIGHEKAVFDVSVCSVRTGRDVNRASDDTAPVVDRDAMDFLTAVPAEIDGIEPGLSFLPVKFLAHQ